jgi:penicillin-insensitive murein DD-endopeptidase
MLARACATGEWFGYHGSVARSRSLLCALAAGTFIAVFALPRGFARASLAEELHLRPSAELRSVSLRYPWSGRLRRGIPVRESDRIRYVDEYREHQRFYGTWQLVQLIERAALRVAQQAPGARLSLGELSQQEGGRIPGHRSHRNGRDVDIGFYLQDEAGQPAAAPTFVPLRRSGRGNHAGQSYHFDVERNWALVAKLLDDDDAHVQYVFVANALRSRLLAHADASDAPPWLIERAKATLVEPRHGNRHQSHFHVRIYCPSEDRPYCRDKPPYFPWYGGLPVILTDRDAAAAPSE